MHYIDNIALVVIVHLQQRVLVLVLLQWVDYVLIMVLVDLHQVVLLCLLLLQYFGVRIIIQVTKLHELIHIHKLRLAVLKIELGAALVFHCLLQQIAHKLVVSLLDSDHHQVVPITLQLP